MLLLLFPAIVLGPPDPPLEDEEAEVDFFFIVYVESGGELAFHSLLVFGVSLPLVHGFCCSPSITIESRKRGPDNRQPMSSTSPPILTSGYPQESSSRDCGSSIACEKLEVHLTQDPQSAKGGLATFQLQTILRRLRAFLISNSVAIVSALPSMLWGMKPSSPLVRYLCVVFRLSLVVAALEVLSSYKKQKRMRKRLLLASLSSSDGASPTSDEEEQEEEEEDAHRTYEKTPGGDKRLESLARMLCFAAPLETLTTTLSQRFLSSSSSSPNFLVLLFAFEVSVDFWHYVAHRLCHSHPTLYRLSGHKTHHSITDLSAAATFCQDPLDLLLTNVVPVTLTLYVMRRFLGWGFSPVQYQIALGYKTWLEVAGHVGVESSSTSFPLLVYLPRALGIELRTRDHTVHHERGGRSNFSKRFTLWDKVFGTFE